MGLCCQALDKTMRMNEGLYCVVHSIETIFKQGKPSLMLHVNTVTFLLKTSYPIDTRAKTVAFFLLAARFERLPIPIQWLIE